MGEEVSRTFKENEVAARMRDYQIAVSYRWAKDAYRTLTELLRFRLLMIRLEDNEPEIYKVVNELYRGIDTRQLGLYDGNKFKNEPNGEESVKKDVPPQHQVSPNPT